MRNRIDCRKKEYKNGLKCRTKRFHNHVCKGRTSETANVMKGVVSLASPQLALAVVGADVGKYVYKQTLC